METPAPVSVGSNATRVPRLPSFLAAPARSHPRPSLQQPTALSFALSFRRTPAEPPLDRRVKATPKPRSCNGSLCTPASLGTCTRMYTRILYVMRTVGVRPPRVWVHPLTYVQGNRTRCACAHTGLRKVGVEAVGVPARSIWWTDAPTPSTGRPTRFTKFRPSLPPTRLAPPPRLLGFFPFSLCHVKQFSAQDGADFGRTSIRIRVSWG